MEQYFNTNGIRLHTVSYGSGDNWLIFMHGLTANCRAFEGLIAAGLADIYHVVSVDLRGRGLSDQPATGYTMADHARDIIGLMDAMGIGQAVVGGHSFGALLSFYMAAHYPELISKLILLDAAEKMHPDTREMLAPALSRLGQTYENFETYLGKVKQAPYLDFWEDDMLSYYRADVRDNADGSVSCIPDPMIMVQAVTGALAEPWTEYISQIKHPAILVNGPGIYTMGAALLPAANAMDTAGKMKNCHYVAVSGNHQTMLYGDGARQTVAAIKEFESLNQ